MDYEIRFIVWKVFGVTQSKKQVLDLFVKVTLDSEGWSGNSQQKETDVHLMSQGDAVFNFRMKFHVKIPCPFPRIKMQVYDFETFSTDSPICETIIEFESIFEKIQKEGYYQQPETEFQLLQTNDTERENGKILVSFEFLSKSDAESNPVGEG